MKKILLCFLTALVTFVANAKCDTIRVVPSDPFIHELTVDKVKYPFLTTVSWKHDGGDLSQNDTLKHVGDKTYVDVKEATINKNEGWYYYEFEVNSTKVRDTVLYVHIYDKPNFKVEVNDSKHALIDEGDTAKFKIKMKNDLLNLDSVIVLLYNDTLVTSTTPEFNCIPTKSGDLKIIVKNKYKSTTNSTLSITVVPILKITSLAYSVHSSNDSYVKTSVSDEMDVKVFNHDSVRLVINSNAKEVSDLTAPVIFAWNKDGLRLPDGISARTDTLVFSEFKKPEMDGKYHCMVSDYRSTLLVTFNVESEYPASNENIQSLSIYCSNGNLVLNNVLNKSVVISDILGKIIHRNLNCSYQEHFTVPINTVLLIAVDNEVHKIMSK